MQSFHVQIPRKVTPNVGGSKTGAMDSSSSSYVISYAIVTIWKPLYLRVYEIHLYMYEREV